MSRKSHKDHAAKRDGVGYVALPHVVLRNERFGNLSPRATKLLCDLLAQYRGDNNGDFHATLGEQENVHWQGLRARGWLSKAALASALTELITANFVVETRKGGRHKASLYGVTFYAIDQCGGKLDIQAPTRRFMGSWNKPAAPGDGRVPRNVLAPMVGQKQRNYPKVGANWIETRENCPTGRPNQPTFPTSIAPLVGSFLQIPLPAAMWGRWLTVN